MTPHPDPLLYTLEEVLERPDPVWLIRHILPFPGLSLLYGPSGRGKAQPLDELVLTPDGWCPMGTIQPGDQVIGSSGLPITVLVVHPQGELPEWCVTFADGGQVRCCQDHLWEVTKGSGAKRGVEVRSTQSLVCSGHHKELHWTVPIVAPVAFRHSGDPLPLDPYLLGALLGDGGLTHYAGFTSADEENIAQVRHRLPPGCSLVKESGQYAYKITTPRGQPNPVYTALRLLGLAGHKSPTKYIPEEYLLAPPAERLLLLQGLMDTDGYVSAGNGSTCDFSSSSRQLTEGVEFLVRSLGGLTNPIRIKKTQGLDAHVITFRLGRGACPFLLSRKILRCGKGPQRLYRRIERVEATGRVMPMQCLTVGAQNGLYVTKDFAVTHNSFVALDWALSVASGEAWLGHYPIDTPGAVIYIACEGTGGLKRRISAWLAHHPDVGSPEEISFCLHALDVYDAEERTRLLAELDRLYPIEPTIYMDTDTGEQELEEYTTPLRLIVIDTVARVFQGDDENDNAQMGDFIAAIEEFATVHNAAVVPVHHSAKAKSSNERGGGALRGAMDACWECKGEKREGKLVKIALVCNKMKDAEEITVGMEMIEYELPTLSLDEEGKVRRCGALGYMELAKPKEEDVPAFSPSEVLLTALHDTDGLTSGEWYARTGIESRTSFTRYRDQLHEEGKIMKHQSLWYMI